RAAPARHRRPGLQHRRRAGKHAEPPRTDRPYRGAERPPPAPQLWGLAGRRSALVRQRHPKISPGDRLVAAGWRRGGRAPAACLANGEPPELRIPQHTLAALDGLDALTVAVGPHASSTPRIAVKKLGVDAGVQGECEEVLVKLADTPREAWGTIAGLVRRDNGDIVVQG